MRKMIWRYCAVFLMVVASGGVLMQVSQQVQQKQREIKIHEHKILREQENIRVLKAEWAYLNNPARLERFVAQGMALSPVQSESLLSDLQALPVPSFEDSDPLSSLPDIRQDAVFDPLKPQISPSPNPSIFIRTNMRQREGG